MRCSIPNIAHVRYGPELPMCLLRENARLANLKADCCQAASGPVLDVTLNAFGVFRDTHPQKVGDTENRCRPSHFPTLFTH